VLLDKPETDHRGGRYGDCPRRNLRPSRKLVDRGRPGRKRFEQTDFAGHKQVFGGHEAHSDLYDGLGSDSGHVIPQWSAKYFSTLRLA